MNLLMKLPNGWDYLELSCTPTSENCSQVGGDYEYSFEILNALECEVFKDMLNRLFPIPVGIECKYVINNNPHEFGDYKEVAIMYKEVDGGRDDSEDRHIDFAYNVENNLPEKWDGKAIEKFKETPRGEYYLQRFVLNTSKDAETD